MSSELKKYFEAVESKPFLKMTSPNLEIIASKLMSVDNKERLWKFVGATRDTAEKEYYAYFPTALNTRVKNILKDNEHAILFIKYNGWKTSNNGRKMHSYYVEVLN